MIGHHHSGLASAPALAIAAFGAAALAARPLIFSEMEGGGESDLGNGCVRPEYDPLGVDDVDLEPGGSGGLDPDGDMIAAENWNGRKSGGGGGSVSSLVSIGDDSDFIARFHTRTISHETPRHLTSEESIIAL